MQLERVRIRVPASTANLGPGFDTLGMALNLYAWIELERAANTSFELYGDQLNGIPTDKSNLIYQVAQMVFNEAGVFVPELAIRMYTDIPLTRGLGSSASAIVGALAAANALIGNPLSKDRLFQLATKLENHPDNVGASLFGGIISAIWNGQQAAHVRIQPDDRIEVLVAVPEFQLSTEKARGILPSQFSKADAIFNISHASVLVAALCTGQLDMIRLAMKDKVHQPYRASLIPGMERILEEAVHHGALGVALSGAGPTLLALVDRTSADKGKLEKFLLETLKAEGIAAKSHWLKPDLDGVVELEGEELQLPFQQLVKGLEVGSK